MYWWKQVQIFISSLCKSLGHGCLLKQERPHFGIQRALGAVFFTCIDEFTVNEIQWFFETEGAANALLSFASSLDDDVNYLYTQRYSNSELENNVTGCRVGLLRLKATCVEWDDKRLLSIENNVTSLKKMVGAIDTAFNCSELNVTQRFDNFQYWKVRYQILIVSLNAFQFRDKDL